MSIKVSGDLSHVIISPAIYADEKVLNFVVVIKFKRHRVRESPDGTSKTIHNFFPSGLYIYFRGLSING